MGLLHQVEASPHKRVPISGSSSRRDDIIFGERFLTAIATLNDISQPKNKEWPGRKKMLKSFEEEISTILRYVEVAEPEKKAAQMIAIYDRLANSVLPNEAIDKPVEPEGKSRSWLLFHLLSRLTPGSKPSPHR